MPTELEELVEFIAHPNAKIRLAATEHLVPYSLSDPSIFKVDDLKPIKHLKLLIRDHPKILEHVAPILINLSADNAVLEDMAKDDKFLDALLARLIKPDEPNGNLLAMILANMAKSDSLMRIIDKKQPAPEKLKADDQVLNQLVDLFIRGTDATYNKDANYEYLSYVFADLTKHAPIRQFFVTRQEFDSVIPLSKIKVFTEHESHIRRSGVVSTIKNVAFEVTAHPSFLSDDEDEINILPYVLLPLMGPESYDEDEMMDMLPELQLLMPDKKRDPDTNIIKTHIETLLLLATTRPGRERMREVKVYPVIRETHLASKDEDVREACERLVGFLINDEAKEDEEEKSRVTELADDEDEIVEV